MTVKKHTFAICAYKESAYLEECIKSLKSQTMPSEIIMVTSTPNEWIIKNSDKYQIPLRINPGPGGIVQDWNFAYRMAETDLVTITHQDDIYLSGYTEEILRMVGMHRKPLIAFTDYGEIREGKTVVNNSLLKIKRAMLFPLRFRGLQNSRFVRRRILSLGSPICCPAVTFVKENLPEQVFKPGFRSDEDWEAWEMLSKIKGAFAYSSKIGMYHRIHEESETTLILGDKARTEEDLVMFRKFWPVPIAKVLAKLYSNSEKSNKL